MIFNEDGSVLFTGGEDGVVNAWCVLDLADEDHTTSSSTTSSIHPFQTWSEHHLPITSLCLLSSSSSNTTNGGYSCGGLTRLVSTSLDRNLIIMELSPPNNNIGSSSSASPRTLVRMCLPAGIHTLIYSDGGGRSGGGQRLYGGGHDGNIYCIDLDKYAIVETTSSGGGGGVGGGGGGEYGSTVVNVNQSGKTAVDFESMLSGGHVLPSSSSTAAAAAGSSGLLSTDQSKYVSELKGHVKAVTSLALLDPSNLISLSSPNCNNSNSTVLLASGSDDGTLRIWDLYSRSCVKVIKPWSTAASEGISGASATAAAATSNRTASSSTPITAIIAIHKSSLSSSTLMSSMTASSSSSSSRRGNNSQGGGGDLASLFKPLKSFIRGTSVVNHSSNDDGDKTRLMTGGGECVTPILWPRRDDTYVEFWEESAVTVNTNTIPRKRAKMMSSSSGVVVGDDKAEIARLKQQLAEAQSQNERWKSVNNQLVAKLKGST